MGPRSHVPCAGIGMVSVPRSFTPYALLLALHIMVVARGMYICIPSKDLTLHTHLEGSLTY